MITSSPSFTTDPGRTLPTQRPIPFSNVSTPLVARANPWNRVGRSFKPTGNADQALTRSGLEWQVAKVGLRTDDLQPVAGSFAIRRSDTNRILGIVGPDYVPLQNADAFAFFRALARERRISFETAGCFQHGAITWVLAHLPDLGIHLGDDESRTYLLISNGHVGNRPVTIAPTTIRVACWNTLQMAEAEIAGNRKQRPGLAGGFQVRHTAGMAATLEDIRHAYAATLQAQEVTLTAWQFLAGKPLTTRMEKRFLAEVWTKAVPDEADRAAAIRKTREDRLGAILASPTSQVKGTKDTAFSLFQAVVEYVDHDRTTRTEDGVDPQEQRLLSATFGSGAELKRKAWDAILALTGA